jgi:hypothetical protein
MIIRSTRTTSDQKDFCEGFLLYLIVAIANHCWRVAVKSDATFLVVSVWAIKLRRKLNIDQQ